MEVRPWWLDPRGEGFGKLLRLGGLGGGREPLGGDGGVGAGGLGGGGGGPMGRGAAFPGGSGNLALVFSDASVLPSDEWVLARKDWSSYDKLFKVDGSLKSLLLGLPMVSDFCEEPEQLNLKSYEIAKKLKVLDDIQS